MARTKASTTDADLTQVAAMTLEEGLVLEVPEVVTDQDLPQGDPELQEESLAVNTAIPTLPEGKEDTTDASFEVTQVDEELARHQTEFEKEQSNKLQEARDLITGSNAFDELIHDLAGPMPKDLSISPDHPLQSNVRDVVLFGDSDTWKLICKASSRNQGWMKTTKAMEMGGLGVLVQTETQQRNEDGSYSLSQSVVEVRGVRIQDVYNTDGKLTGRMLVPTH